MYGNTYQQPWKPEKRRESVAQATSLSSAEALGRELAPGSSLVALDPDRDAMYVVTVDGWGVVRASEWEIRRAGRPEEPDPGAYLTRAEFYEWLGGAGPGKRGAE